MTEPTTPLSRHVVGRIALKTCVAWLIPASAPLAASAHVAYEWPIDARIPFLASNLISGSAPFSSGAIVIMVRTGAHRLTMAASSFFSGFFI
jgi:hypothetical protein